MCRLSPVPKTWPMTPTLSGTRISGMCPPRAMWANNSPVEMSCRKMVARSASVASAIVSMRALSCSSSVCSDERRSSRASSALALTVRGARPEVAGAPSLRLLAGGMGLLQLFAAGADVLAQVPNLVEVMAFQDVFLLLVFGLVLLQLVAHGCHGGLELGGLGGHRGPHRLHSGVSLLLGRLQGAAQLVHRRAQLLDLVTGDGAVLAAAFVRGGGLRFQFLAQGSNRFLQLMVLAHRQPQSAFRIIRCHVRSPLRNPSPS